MAGYGDRAEVPGIVTLVSVGDTAHVDTIGVRSFDRVDPGQRDTIFRVDSLPMLVDVRDGCQDEVNVPGQLLAGPLNCGESID